MGWVRWVCGPPPGGSRGLLRCCPLVAAACPAAWHPKGTGDVLPKGMFAWGSQTPPRPGEPERCSTEGPEGVAQVVWGSGSTPRGASGRPALWAAAQTVCPGLGQVCWLVAPWALGRGRILGLTLHVPDSRPHPRPPGHADPLWVGRAPTAPGAGGGEHKETESGLVPGLEKNSASHPLVLRGKTGGRKSRLTGLWLLPGPEVRGGADSGRWAAQHTGAPASGTLLPPGVRGCFPHHPGSGVCTPTPKRGFVFQVEA